MRRILLMAALTLAVQGRANAQLTPEEKVVRVTYAKLRYAIKIGVIHDVVAKNSDVASAELESKIAANEISFELSNFASGPTTDIAKRPYSSLVTKPNGEDILDVATVEFTSTEDLPATLEVRETREAGAKADWGTGQTVTGDWTVPFEQVAAGIDTQNRSKYLRYASYHVTVTYGGRSRGYNAMFLFGTGDFPVLALDNVTNNSALTSFVQKSVYPAILLESKLSRKPAVANWLKSNQVRDPSCVAGQKQACCDATTQVCGPSEGDVRTSLNKPSADASKPSSRMPAAAVRTGAPRLLNVSMPLAASRSIGECSDFNSSGAGTVANDSDDTQHQPGGHHYWHDAPTGTCTYEDQSGGHCTAHVATSNAGLSVSEAGLVTGDCHAKGINSISPSADGDAPSVTAVAAATALPCNMCACTATITITSPTNVVFPAGNIWNKQNPYSRTCGSRTLPGSPIIIDTTGHGFHLTSQHNGVIFDLAGTGRPELIAWTDASYDNAFLALDRNGDGRINSGKELFGNFTAQPRSDDPNGFIALAVYDESTHGGNGDGIIDEHDNVWRRLKLWIDENHDGVSQPEELHTLEELGVYSIGLRYVQTRRFDEFGNIFRYKGRINQDGEPRHDPVNKTIFDVFLVTTGQ